MTTRTKGAWILGALLTASGWAQAEPPGRAVFVSAPVVPTITPAVRDLPDWKPDPELFGLEMKRRDDFGFIPIIYPIKPTVDPLFDQQQFGQPSQPDSFSTLVHNYAGQTSGASPPDDTGDVGLSHFVQSVNQSVSTVQVLDKNTGANLKTFTMQSLTTASPCRNGFCDPVVLYDRMADRWLISELPSSGGSVCVYVSTTGDPTGTWFAYSFPVETSLTDYPKYGVWPQNGNGGSYLIGANAGSGSSHDLFALDRAKMLAGLPATFQKFSVADLPNSGFQLVLPSAMQGNSPPPDGEPAVFMRPRDDEAQDGASTPTFDLMELWALHVDWATPANSTLTPLPSVHIGDYDMTLCGLGNIWNCMPQPGTSQKIDPIREPLHFPLQYRNFADHQTLVGTFVEDVDGTDHAALRWFEMRKTGAGAWTLYQEGLVGGEAGVHRSVASIAMDGSGNIAIGYTRTGGSAPYYPSIYYRGRLSTDTLGTMPQGEYVIVDATTSKTGNERWGDYSGIGIDPVDDCTFWFTTEYGGSGNTRVAAFKFDGCGCAVVPAAPSASASAPQDNRIDVTWTDSATATITQYFVLRSTASGGPYTQLATVPDSSLGVPNGPSYTYHDDTVSGGTRYYYVVKSSDGGACVSAGSSEASALATGQCRLAPTFSGVASVTNPGNSTCSLDLSWTAGASVCSGTVAYNVYRSVTSGFAPAPANRIAAGVTGTGTTDSAGIVGGTTYYYVVRAVDGVNGLEDTNTTQKSGTPTGPLSSSSWTDTFEGSQSGGGFDRAGWNHNAITGSTNWAWSTTQKHDGTHSWFAADVTGVNDKVLVSPSFGVGPTTTMSFFHTYRFEFSSSTCWDAGTLEATTDGGTTWTVVPAGDFTAGGYNGTVTTSSSNPIGGKPAWCSGVISTMTQVAVNLGGDASLVNKTVRVRWHEGDDQATTSTGWFVDTVAINNLQTGGACTPGAVCTAPGAPNLTGAASDCSGANLTWSAGAGATSSYDVYRGTVSGGPYTKLGGMPVTGTAYSDTTGAAGTIYYYVVKGACDVDGAVESPFSNERSASKKAEGAACDDTNPCTQSDTCQSGACVGGAPLPVPSATSGLVFASTSGLSWDGTSGATVYDVVRGTLSTLLGGGSFSSATDVCLADRIPDTFVSDSHVPAEGDADWFLIRGDNACGAGTYDDGAPSQAGSRDPGIAASPNACP